MTIDVTRVRSGGSRDSWLARRVFGAAVILCAARYALAEPVYTWDANGPAVGVGGAGAWDTTSPCWTIDGGSHAAWPTIGTTHLACFGGTGGVVTVGSAVSVNRLNFNAAGYSIANTASGVLTLNGTTPVIDTGGFNVSFNMLANGLTLAAGTTVLTKSGTGTLTVVNAPGIGANVTWNVVGGTLNSSTGLFNSTLAMPDGSKLGNAIGSVLGLNGGTFAFTQSGGPGLFSARTVNVTGAGGTLSDGGFAPGTGGGGSTISPAIVIADHTRLHLVGNNNLTLDAGNAGTPAGVISGGGGITVYGKGVTKILSTGHTYTGGTTVSAGSTLLIGNASSLGATTNDLTLAGNLNLVGNTLPVGKITSNAGTIAFRVGANTINQINAAAAAMTGYTGIEIDAITGSTITPGVYTLIHSAGGGLNGTVGFAGGQNLSVPTQSSIQNIGGTSYRLTLSPTGNAVTVTVTPAPAKVLAILPLGSSITAGQSAQGHYDGGGYRSQLYQNLVNDGRFTPRFVGKETTPLAHNPTGVDLMTAVGQGNHEGHPGYPTGAILSNLPGKYLAVGNGIEPDYITLNVGGNDYVQNAADTTAIGRLDQLIAQLATLRPNATVIVSSIVVRTDKGGTIANGFNTLYNPHIPGLVYKHTLAGRHVAFLDLANIMNVSDLSPDGIHPTQAGYNKMADAWTAAITTGQAFYTGNAGGGWTHSASGVTNWALDYPRTLDARVLPSAGTDVYFNGVGRNVALDADVAVRGLNFAAGADQPVTIGGAKTLSIGAGGVTIQAGTAAHTVAANVTLATPQKWTNVSKNTFTVSGNIGGHNALVLDGTANIVLSGNNTFGAATDVVGGTLVVANVAGSATGSGAVTVNTGATLTGTGEITGPADIFGTITAGSAAGSIDTLTTGVETWNGAGRYVVEVSGDGLSNDRLAMSALSIAATPANPFAIALTSTGTPAIDADASLLLASDTDSSAANPFGPALFESATRQKLTLSVSGLRPASGHAFRLDAKPLFDAKRNAAGYGLVLRQISTAPQPTRPAR